MQPSAATSVRIEINSTILDGSLTKPRQGRNSIVIFAHGSGSSRFSPRNLHVAKVLNDSGIGTLLFDLLTEKEDQVYETRFDISLLTERLKSATNWTKNNALATGTPRIGYFGASTGAAAALRAAVDLQKSISAVVSRGGRPDMAGESYLRKVRVPTLLIVGGNDKEVLELNRSAFDLIPSEKKELIVVPNATHLFEEPGALESVARHASKWFQEYL